MVIAVFNYSWFIKNPTSGTSMSLAKHARSDWLRHPLIEQWTYKLWYKSVYRQYWIKHFHKIQLSRLKGRRFYSFRPFCFRRISAVIVMASYLNQPTLALPSLCQTVSTSNCSFATWLMSPGHGKDFFKYLKKSVGFKMCGHKRA
jgi:hypothetical protein